MTEDEAATIEGMIAAGDDDAAFAELRTRFGWPAGKQVAPALLPRWLASVAELAIRRGADSLAELARDAVRDPDSPDRLYDLGYALIDAGAPELAASVLWRCLALVGESEEVVCELVSALESALAYGDALAVLGEYPALRARSFLCRYLYAFNAAMAGQLAITRDTLPLLAPASADEETMYARIVALVGRADRVAGVCPLDGRDLRGWHYVLTGGVLLHLSPYGFDQPMHGRYAWLADSIPRVATGVQRLTALVRDLALPCVYAPPGRSHEILARAVATVLGIPLVPWPAIGVPAPGLVVLYDLAELPAADVARLAQRRPEQIVFAHASPWTQDSPVAPDVTTMLYQTLVAPWGEAIVVNPDAREVDTAPPDDRPADVIAAEIVASRGLDDEDLASEQLDRYAALVERVWPLAPEPRSRLWAGGPVPSSRFA